MQEYELKDSKLKNFIGKTLTGLATDYDGDSLVLKFGEDRVTINAKPCAHENSSVYVSINDDPESIDFYRYRGN
jgi:hypothetical protein